jgi:hypothetical protein
MDCIYRSKRQKHTRLLLLERKNLAKGQKDLYKVYIETKPDYTTILKAVNDAEEIPVKDYREKCPLSCVEL